MSDGGAVRGRKRLFQRSKKRAFDCLHKREFSRAFAHFVIALTIEPEDEEMLNLFLYSLNMLSNELEVQENWNDLLMCYQQTLEVLPHNAQVLHGLATTLFRLGHIESATGYFQKAFKENPFYTPSLYCVDNIKNSLVERWHFTMLNDKRRNSAFADAIGRAVSDGCTAVLDIGAGTGILSMIALDAGAETVYACEGSQVMFDVMEAVVEANGKDIQLLDKLSYDLKIPEDLPERVNLVVTEIFDAGLFGEHVLQTLKHAWDELLCVEDERSADDVTTSPRSRVLPQSAVVWAAVIECPKMRKEFRMNDESLDALGLTDFQVIASFLGEEPYSTERLRDINGGYTLLCKPQILTTVDFNNVEEITNLLSGRTLCLKYDCNVSGQIDAIALWFDLNLDAQTKLSTEPESGNCWEQAVFYVLPHHLQGTSPVVKPGDCVSVEFLCKGHLTLQKVSTPAAEDVPDSVPVEPSIVQSANSLATDGVLSLNVVPKTQKAPLVVDISMVPIVGLKALRNGAEKLVVLPSKSLLGINRLQELCHLPKEKLRVMSYEDICVESICCDVLIAEPVEIAGLLRKNVFEDIALMRSFSSVDPPMVYPRQLYIYAALIESDGLYQRARIVSDDNCMGYKISQFLNIYQCNVYQDIQLSALPHDRLSDRITLGRIDLDKLLLERNKLQSFVEFRGTVEARISKTGTVTAIPYWFEIVYDSDRIVNTGNPESMWKQAAVIPDDTVSVVEGDVVLVTWTCRNSCLHITVNKT